MALILPDPLLPSAPRFYFFSYVYWLFSFSCFENFKIITYYLFCLYVYVYVVCACMCVHAICICLLIGSKIFLRMEPKTTTHVRYLIYY